jgi:hypothetical protein
MSSPVLRQLSRLLLRAILTMGLVISFAALPAASPQADHPWASSVHLPAATAQRVQIDQVWQQVYQEVPGIPLENEYVNKDTGDVSTNNTLINRLIRYHIYVKGRPTAYRLDWKLTLADYLGVNERMDEQTYPSGTSLRINPLDRDVTAVRSLNRAQRDALVNVLVSLFNPNSQIPSEPPAPTPSPTVAPSPVNPPVRFPAQPQPGDAQLLQP